MSREYILDLREARAGGNIGGKAESLRFLARKGFSTPATQVCTWDAYEEHARDEVAVAQALKAELEAKLDAGRRYAVRSSANLEDSFDASFAGQFKSVLDAGGTDEILQAISSVWATTRSPSVQSYLEKRGIDPQTLRMAVIVQEMVSPQVSGVSFSKNPITGLDEVIVEAVRGSGEALVQEGATPSRWVHKWGVWLETPHETDIKLELIEAVVRGTKAIARARGRPVDLEWVYDGESLYWVQMRDITALDIPIYSNRISREVFPGIIKPLIWSVNVPLVNGAWVDLFTELIGPNDIEPESLAGYFYYRAYFDMGALGRIFELLGLPRETLEVLMGIEVEGPEKPSFKPSSKTYALLPRMLGFALDKMRFASKVDAFLPAMEAQFQDFPRERLAALGEQELLDEIDRLYPLAQEAAYYNIVTPLLMQVYNRILRGQLHRLGVEFERFDLTGDMEELERFEPNVHLSRLNRLYAQLDEGIQFRLPSASYEEFLAMPGIELLQQGVARFLADFGHLSDSGNDFSHEPWRENPDLILQMIVSYSPPETGAARQVEPSDLDVPLWRRPLFQPVFRRARQFRWYREAVSSLYTFGYGLFRDHFLALGARLAQRGVLAEKEDVFYLYMDEVREIAASGSPGDRYRALVAERKREIDRVRDIVPPGVIYGDQAPPVDSGEADRLRGVPTSRGHYTGPVRVLTGIQDFGKLRDGDVLVIPYSDVGWTPLFTKAGAVVAESGGILSHSSIVAREYGIPAVVSVPGACRLADNTVVTVDGYRGEVVIREPLHNE